jgi:hypothetical protein
VNGAQHGNDTIFGGKRRDFITGGGGNDRLYRNAGDSEAGVSLDRTASVQRLPNGIRVVPQEPRMATPDQTKSTRPTSRKSNTIVFTLMRTRQRCLFSGQLSRTQNSPSDAHFGAKVLQTVRPACSLQVLYLATTRAAPAGFKRITENDSQYRRAA